MKHILLYLFLMFTVGITQAKEVQVFANNVTSPEIFGEVTFGDIQPQVIYRHPQAIYQKNSQYSNPVYVYIPAGHEEHWAKYCGRYNLCDSKVYFVQGQWYRDYKLRIQKQTEIKQNFDSYNYKYIDRGLARGWTNSQRESANDRHR